MYLRFLYPHDDLTTLCDIMTLSLFPVFDVTSIFSHWNIATFVYIRFPFIRTIFLHDLNYSPHVTLQVKRGPRRLHAQHIESCLFIDSASHCLLIAFAFKVISNNYLVSWYHLLNFYGCFADLCSFLPLLQSSFVIYDFRWWHI